MKTKRTAIVTGAGRGIGKTCALGLADMGYRVALVARSEQQLKLVAEAIEEKYPGDAACYPMNVTRPEKIKGCVHDVVHRWGGIDLLVNNAGIYSRGTTSLDVAEFEQLLSVNLIAAFSFLKAVTPVMKQQQNGYIFNIASRAGKIGFAQSGGYVASKFGLVGLSESLYRELAGQGVSVTAICPGWVNTQMAVEAGSHLPPEEMIQPRDIMKTIAWLLSLSPGACVKEVVLETPGTII